MFQQTTATRKLANLRKRIRVVAGGTSASKTISIILLLIDYAQSTEGKIISIVSESMPHLKKGAMRDFLGIMQAHGYFKKDRWNKTDSVYTFEGNSIIEFFSVESWEKVKGARRHVLFINEANHIDYNSYTQMEVRTKEVIWLDYNPENEFWYYTDIKGVVDHDFITLTYTDNEALDSRIIQSIESRKSNKNWWLVYGLGQLGEVESRIYTGWEIISEIPHEARLQKYGLDFGYSNDPTAIVGIYYYNGGYILDEVAYQPGLKNREIGEILKTLPQAIVVADSAEPKSIDEIKDYGFRNIFPSTKGQGSVMQGITYVQDQRISVTSRSVNLIKEYRNYLWQTDKEGKIINDPQEFMCHALDAVRYGFDVFQKRGMAKQNLDTGGVKPYIEGTLI
jgi:phage terminase large subunit